MIAQCLDNLDRHGNGGGGGDTTATAAAVKEVVAMTMRHAGVAITITSVTDVIVFAIGASSVRGTNIII